MQRLATFAPNQLSVVITQDSTGIAHVVSGYSEDSIVNIEWTTPRYSLTLVLTTQVLAYTTQATLQL